MEARNPDPSVGPIRADVVLVGGGLANSLIALRLAAERPDLNVQMIERLAEDGDAHTWCLFQSDVAAETWRWLRPMLDPIWEGYDVAFPGEARSLSTTYGRLTGKRLRAAISALLGARLHRGVEVAVASAHQVACSDGQTFEAPLVIDGRGAQADSGLDLAWQKFVGLEVELKDPHGLTRPMVMDGDVRQVDGFRFVYVLPLAPDRLLVEDTRYSAAPHLDIPTLETSVSRYARARSWRITNVFAREQGVLPVVLGGDIDGFWRQGATGAARSGMRAALFHPTTGYSLPEAARTAEQIAAAPRLDSAALGAMIEARSKQLWRSNGFYRVLNRMMFLAADPDDRYRVLQRFYRLPQPLIERFYAGRLTFADKVRILAGRPPVSVRRAVAALSPRACPQEAELA